MPSPLAVAAQNRPELRYAWRGPACLLLGNDASCEARGPTGFFFREARHLSGLRLTVQGEQPFFCSVAEAAPHVLEWAFVYPPVTEAGGGGSGSGGSSTHRGLLARTLDLRLRFTLHPDRFEAHLLLANRWDERAELDLAWHLDADFADLIEVTGERQHEPPPDEPGQAVEAEPTERGVRFRYAHDGLPHSGGALPLETHVRAEGGDWRWTDGRLKTTLVLARQETAEVGLVVRAVDREHPLSTEEARRREAHLRAWEEEVATFSAPGETPLAEIANASMRWLGAMALLEGDEDEWLAPAAGYPVYPALFGRDALTATWQAGMMDRCAMLGATLTRLGRLQGTEEDAWRDEEPGRIVQQARRGPLARLGKNPFGRYYGDQASPFMFVIALGQRYAWTGEKADLERHWDAARRVLDWARDYGARDGYVTYHTRSPQGPKHQGWKDSDNAVVYPDGTQVEPPVAASEVQGYWYAALQFMAILSVVMGEVGDGRALWKEAKALKERFNRDFWDDAEGIVAGWMDAEGRLVRSVTSNAGHCLTAGVVDDERVPRLVERLFAPDLFSGWGLRTLSTHNPAYHPLSYHLGSVWAVENATTLFGLRRYGFDERAQELARAVCDLARLWPGGRVPECVGGYDRAAYAHPGTYPRATGVQAWNLSAFPLIVQGLLGLRPVAALDLLAVDPALPAWLPELEVRGLRVGEATVGLRCWRDDGGASHFEVTEQEGTLHVLRQPPLDALDVGLFSRLGALAKSVLPF